MSPHNGWILVVDDDEDIRDVVALVLEEQGYRVVAAFDGQDALERLRDGLGGAPSLILLDLMMPRLSGQDLAREVRGRPELREVPIVVLSGDSRMQETAASLRAAACLPKPFDLRELIETVKRFRLARTPR